MLHAIFQPRGVTPAVVIHGRSPLTLDYGREPDTDAMTSAQLSGFFIEGVNGSPKNIVVDCVRHNFMGKSPNDVKQCTRYVHKKINHDDFHLELFSFFQIFWNVGRLCGEQHLCKILGLSMAQTFSMWWQLEAPNL